MANEKITLIGHLRRCAESARGFAASLIASLAETTSEALSEMDTVKADKSEAVAIELPATGWVSDASAADYRYRYDLAVVGVTASDTAVVSIAPNSMGTAIACGLCPTNQTLAGTIRFWAKTLPTAAIAAEYKIEKGKVN